MSNVAVIFAGGTGQRMNTRTKPKQFLELHGKPIIVYTLEAFDQHSEIDGIIVVMLESWISYTQDLIRKYDLKKIKKVVPGGSSGQESIYNGLCAASEFYSDDDIVLIHDGVRPLINEKLLSVNIESVKKYGSAITSGIVKETIVVIDEDGMVEQVPSRDRSRVAKAPQSFRLEEILAVHERALSEGIDNSIDSCTLMQSYGYKLHMVDGPYENIKITTPDDFYTMRAILDARENEQIYGLSSPGKE